MRYSNNCLIHFIRNVFKIVFLATFLLDIISLIGWVTSILQPQLNIQLIYTISVCTKYTLIFTFFFMFYSSMILTKLVNKLFNIGNFDQLLNADVNRDKRWVYFVFIVIVSELILIWVFQQYPKEVLFINDNWVIPYRISDKVRIITELQARKEMWNSLRFEFALLVSFLPLYTRMVYLFLKSTKYIR